MISPVYNVGNYLSDFFSGLEAQTCGMEELEIILVDDGSTDDSLALCTEFASRHENVRVLTKANGGQASARNLGIEHASAPWITFPDPDDALSPNYFESVAAFMQLEGNRNTRLFGAHILKWFEDRDVVADDHPTGFRFREGSTTVDLYGEPKFIHGNACLSFFRRDIVEQFGLRFHTGLKTRFEDGHFMSQYLLRCDRPTIGLIDEAQYFYRQRSDGSSTVQQARVDVRTYDSLPLLGYTSVLRLAIELKGEIPRWLQTLVLYDFIWLFKSDVHSKIPSRTVPKPALEKFHERIAEIVEMFEPEVILGFDMMTVPAWLLEAAAFGYSDEQYVSSAHVGNIDKRRKLVEIRYRYTGALPSEALYVRGEVVEPHFSKVKDLDVLGRTLLKERSLWVSSRGVVRLEVNGRMRKIEPKERTPHQFKLTTGDIRRFDREQREKAVPSLYRRNDTRAVDQLSQGAKRAARSLRGMLTKEGVFDVLLSTSMRMLWNRRRFGAAWAIMDREFEANDSAEQLYRWIDANRPEIKRWFVLSKKSPDWRRLKNDGFALVDYGSFKWKLLLLLSAHLISSHADVYVTNPLPAGRFGKPQWRFSFLQHGVIKGDLSTWLNRKSIDFMVTSTEDEYRYIVGESPYSLGTAQVRLTGLPRYDALLEKSAAVPASEVNQIVIAPTWRQYLVGKFSSGSTRERNTDFTESDYLKYWQAVVTSDALHEVAKENNLEIVFMPHPNVQPYLDEFRLPSWVKVQHYAGADIQVVISKTALLITDYSSIAFNAAYLHRPVVYFQFDAERYRSEHTEGDAYFEYDQHGFGPVVKNVSDALNATRKLLTDDDFASEYIERARNTFPVRDGRNSERVFNAIEQLDRPLSCEEAAVAAPLDTWQTVAER
ncbi:bifunctional glycosyltransferase/CDP-glycerol:glycerophosphate glycerophosphotransferase [Paramicrobacterium humi]|uniref:bifunctional glycosyltransferase/CDP-glycerol:glycerophosphate glycerophosphotransferase n=1 Tax=Paramicrobacterium humi TaxID=640635 RepID=UPI00115F9788|nr:CDP-glycerol glycerophosphotransferase family protein [Microbacterium humi]